MLSIAYLCAVIFLQSGGNDLLDYAATDAYWHGKQVTVSVEQLSAELKPPAAVDISKPLADLASADAAARDAASKDIVASGAGAIPQLRVAADHAADADVAATAASLIDRIEAGSKVQQVRRLMAIRTLGEMKKRESIAVLEPLEKSREPYVAEYARAAIAAINGDKPATRPAATVNARLGDAWHFPADTAALLQITPTGDTPIALEKIFAELQLPPDRQKEVMASITSGVIHVAEKIGNARLTSLTVGLSGDSSPRSADAGYMVAVLRGSYDSRAAALALAEQKLPTKTVAGMEVFFIQDMAIMVPTDEKAVLVIGTSREKLPLASVIAALDASPGPLTADKDLAALVKETDVSQSLWAVARMTDTFRQDPFLASFESIRLVGRRRADVLELSLAAVGKDADAVATAVAQLNFVVDEALNDAKSETAEMPSLKPVVDFLESIKCNAQGTKATIDARLPDSIVTPAAMLMSLPPPDPVDDIPPAMAPDAPQQ